MRLDRFFDLILREECPLVRSGPSRDRRRRRYLASLRRPETVHDLVVGPDVALDHALPLQATASLVDGLSDDTEVSGELVVIERPSLHREFVHDAVGKRRHASRGYSETPLIRTDRTLR